VGLLIDERIMEPMAFRCVAKYPKLISVGGSYSLPITGSGA
jgi:hypothetical protein